MVILKSLILCMLRKQGYFILNRKNKLSRIMIVIIFCVIIIAIVNISTKVNKKCVSSKNEEISNTIETIMEDIL